MQSTQQTQEIQGIAAQAWGGVFVPTNVGKITVVIKGDVLESRMKVGMSTQTIWTRIQTVNSVEIEHSPSWALIGFGFFMILTGLGSLFGSATVGIALLVVGLAITIYAWLKKRRLLVIYATSSKIPVFMNKPTEIYEKFALQVLAMSRQLNRLPQPSQRPPVQRPQKLENAP